jgi:hypothetical protein
MEMNAGGKNHGNDNRKTIVPNTDYDRSKANGESGIFQHPVGSMITNNARCIREIKSKIAMEKTAFSKKKTVFTNKLDLNVRKELMKCYISSTALYGVKTCRLRKIYQKCLESLVVWCWRGMEEISWTDRVRNEALLHRVKEKSNTSHAIEKMRKAD